MNTCSVCGKPVGYMSRLCGDCALADARIKAQEEAATQLWASQGIHALEDYLNAWAAFELWELTHRQPLSEVFHPLTKGTA